MRGGLDKSEALGYIITFLKGVLNSFSTPPPLPQRQRQGEHATKSHCKYILIAKVIREELSIQGCANLHSIASDK